MHYRCNGLYSSLMGYPKCLPLEQSSCGPGFCVGGRLNFRQEVAKRRWAFHHPSILKVEVFTNATAVFYRQGRHLALAVASTVLHEGTT
jgi:hypothetical protein